VGRWFACSALWGLGWVTGWADAVVCGGGVWAVVVIVLLTKLGFFGVVFLGFFSFFVWFFLLWVVLVVI